jgi:hypothetical protein
MKPETTYVFFLRTLLNQVSGIQQTFADGQKKRRKGRKTGKKEGRDGVGIDYSKICTFGYFWR